MKGQESKGLFNAPKAVVKKIDNLIEVDKPKPNFTEDAEMIKSSLNNSSVTRRSAFLSYSSFFSAILMKAIISYASSSVKVLSIDVSPPLNTFASSLPTSIP